VKSVRADHNLHHLRPSVGLELELACCEQPVHIHGSCLKGISGCAWSEWLPHDKLHIGFEVLLAPGHPIVSIFRWPC
jgi:hypothetical protein